jgi:hypothetical protein
LPRSNNKTNVLFCQLFLGTILENGVFMKAFRPDRLRVYGHKRRGTQVPGSEAKSAKADSHPGAAREHVGVDHGGFDILVAQ